MNDVNRVTFTINGIERPSYVKTDSVSGARYYTNSHASERSNGKPVLPAAKLASITTNGRREPVYEMQDTVTGAIYCTNDPSVLMVGGKIVRNGKGKKAPAAHRTKRQTLGDWMREGNAQIQSGELVQ